MKYSIFRDMVLAKTTGENVHLINGELGTILNEIRNYNFWKYKKKQGENDKN